MDKIQSNARKMWSKDEAKGMTVKHFFKASEKNQSWCLRVLFSQKKKALQNIKKDEEYVSQILSTTGSLQEA